MPNLLGHSGASFAVRTARTLLALVLSSPLLGVLPIYAQHSRVFPATPGEPLSAQFHVAVDSQPSPSYLATVGSPANFKNDQEILGQAAFTSFDINGVAHVTVTYAQPVTKAQILPTALGIKPVVSGKQITFAVSQPGQLTLEVNGDWTNSLHLFVNSFETSIPSPTDPKVIYYKPGIYQLSQVRVNSGQTVYLAPGAFLYAKPGTVGPLFDLNGSNITMRGRGVIDGSRVPWHGGNLLYVYQGFNVQVEGITLRDSSGWTFHLFGSQNVQISNVKEFGWRLNSDGLDIDTSQNVSVTNSFFRVYDDQIVVKTNNLSGGKTANINVSKCVVWNQIAHALTLGSELLGPVQNVSFSDIDIIHDKGRMALLAVYNADTGLVQNVTWSDIRIEQVQRLLALNILGLPISQTKDRGHIANITFSNIVAPAPSRAGLNLDVEGYDYNHSIRGVRFDDVKIGGATLRQSDITQNPYVDGVTVTP